MKNFVSTNRRCLLVLGVIACLFYTISQVYSEDEQIIEAKSYIKYVSDMEPILAIGKYIKDKDVEGNLIDLGTIKFEKGLCVPSNNSKFTYKIPTDSSIFKAVVGNDNAFAEYPGELTFIIYVDDQKVYESKPIKQNEKEEISVSVKRGSKITLEVKDDGTPTNYAVWADASFF